MAINIKSLQTERLARTVAATTGESLTEAIKKALEERLDRIKRQRQNPTLATRLDEILRRVDELPNRDSRSEDEILGYDEHGLPR